MEKLRKRMLENMISYNTNFKNYDVSDYSEEKLLANTHPIDREDFEQKLLKLNKE